MGYETILLIGKDTKMGFAPDEGIYFQVYAHVDMCKLGNSQLFNLPWLNKTPEDKFWFWYAPTGDGDTQIEEDRYGDKPRPVPLLAVLEALEEDMSNADYRRLWWAYQLLLSMHETSPGELSVLMWSY